ncbi:MAG TPA: hypothetical protein VJC10_02765 [Patescibacteria group bacterium]|nr:hypothetical protein [Patescibacteria group bacterium]
MQLIVVVIIIVAVITGVYLVQRRTNFLPKASMPSYTSGQSINSASDLDKNLNDLENTDINQLDQGLSENSSDASSF